MKVLVIDDNADLATMISRMLEAGGYECIVANDGKNGLTMLQQTKFDAAILDLAMPGFTGFDVIDALEKNGKLKEQKIVVLTAAEVSNEKMEELKKRGVSTCLRKPVTINVLYEALKN